MNPAQVEGAKKGWATRKQRDACWEAKHGMRKRPARWRCDGEKPGNAADGPCALCRKRWLDQALAHIAEHQAEWDKGLTRQDMDEMVRAAKSHASLFR